MAWGSNFLSMDVILDLSAVLTEQRLIQWSPFKTLSVTSLASTGMVWFLSAFWMCLTKPEDRKHPNPAREKASKRHEIREREQTVPTFACGDSSASVHCGFHGVVPYHHPPKTTYQLLARVKPTANLQQFTRCFPKKKVERCVVSLVVWRLVTDFDVACRVVSIPLVANADYRG